MLRDSTIGSAVEPDHCQKLHDAIVRLEPAPHQEEFLQLSHEQFLAPQDLRPAGSPGNWDILTEEEAHRFRPNSSRNDIDVAVARYKEDTRWSEYLQRHGMNVTVRTAEGIDETVAFVRHLLESYDSNRSMFVFLHGNAPEDWHSPWGILPTITHIDLEKLRQLGGYASLNRKYRNKLNSSQHFLLEYRVDCLWRDDAWMRMLKERWGLPDIGAFSGRDGRYCCSQFAVTREAVRSFPKAFYESLLERVTKREPWGHFSYKTYGRTMAVLWHVVFTGKVQEPKYLLSDFSHCSVPPDCVAAAH